MGRQAGAPKNGVMSDAAGILTEAARAECHAAGKAWPMVCAALRWLASWRVPGINIAQRPEHHRRAPIRYSVFSVGLLLVLSGGCTSVDSRNVDSKPWNLPPSPEIQRSCWPWWPPLLFGSSFAEQQWQWSRQKFGR